VDGIVECRIVTRRTLFLAAAVALAVSAGAQATTRFARRSLAHARVDAANELASARVPHGARKLRSDPSIARGLRPQRVGCIKKYVVEDHRFWRVAGKPAAVWTWMLKHPPRRRHSVGSGMLLDHGKPIAWSIWFILPDQRTVVGRMVAVSLRPARGGGTAIRVDAIAVGEPRSNQAPCFTAH